MEVYTIGFTKRTAADFFQTLKRAGVKHVLDVRLNNVSQLAGFAKRDDLAFFLKEICGAQYTHEPLLAPTKDILDAYRGGKLNWQGYTERFLALMAERRIQEKIDRSLFEQPTALLCSESTPDRCHRRLVLEYLKERWPDLRIIHL